ncbi:hypothetical protein FRC07_012413 [Ceratobasidium sp. 392]|nr:hypothetical protein FRC07_012413 [Ceratobasidium sp. 392]
MADFFTTTSIADKAATVTITQHDEQNAKAALEVTGQMSDKKKRKLVLQRCHKSTIYDKQRHQWPIPRTRKEEQLRNSVVRIINTIKGSVDTSMERTSMNAFVDRTGQTINADCELSPLTRPNLVLFDDAHEAHEHWETVRTTISVKRLKSHLKAAMTGLAYDARAVFTHQVHRWHLYSLAICGSEATFVRFDRAGVLYSPPIDMRADSDRFTMAVAALFMMSDEAFGFDTAFTTRMNEKQRLDYYVDLPEPASGDGYRNRGQASTKLALTRFKVVECLCNRGDIIGKATIALHIKKLKTSKTQSDEVGLHVKTRGQKRAFEQVQLDELCDEGFVLKLVWRDPTQESEGYVLKQLVGTMCVDETIQIKDMLVCKNLSNIQGAVCAIDGGKDYRYQVIHTNRLESVSETRERRIYSRILFSSLGKPLTEAESPRELLTGMLDTILGIIHRDVSDGNVMLLPPRQNAHRRERKEQLQVAAKTSSESEMKLAEYLEGLDHEPAGILSDFDMHIQVSNGKSPRRCTTKRKDSTRYSTNSARGKGDELPRVSGDKARSEKYQPHVKRRKTQSSYVSVIPSEYVAASSRHTLRRTAPHKASTSEHADYRTGTVPFMSVTVLSARPGQKYEHSFMDDLESFFWVLLYTVASHTDPGVNTMTPTASRIVDQLDLEDMDALGSFFYDDSSVLLSELTPAEVFPRIAEIFVDALRML